MNLENLGVQEMSEQEVKQVEGGWYVALAVAVGAGMAWCF